MELTSEQASQSNERMRAPYKHTLALALAHSHGTTITINAERAII